jgi:hypothetical protein
MLGRHAANNYRSSVSIDRGDGTSIQVDAPSPWSSDIGSIDPVSHQCKLMRYHIDWGDIQCDIASIRYCFDRCDTVLNRYNIVSIEEIAHRHKLIRHRLDQATLFLLMQYRIDENWYDITLIEEISNGISRRYDIVSIDAIRQASIQNFINRGDGASTQVDI